MRGRSISGLCLLINLIPSSPGIKRSGVSDILTVHCRAGSERFMQQESVRLSPGHTIDTDGGPEHTINNNGIINLSNCHVNVITQLIIKHALRTLFG